MPEISTIVVVAFLSHLVLGAAWLAAVYLAFERGVKTAVVTGWLLGAGIIVVDKVVGESLGLTLAGAEAGIIAAAFAAVVGASVFLLSFKPGTEVEGQQGDSQETDIQEVNQ